jgi:bifunctional oligoribonuclease and PAP phosphatase NrnA
VYTRVLAERSPGGLRAMAEILGEARQLLAGRLFVGRVPHDLHVRHGLVEGDLEGVVESLLLTEGTEVAALLIERPDGSVKVSLRSRTDLDVARLAKTLTPWGGGHPRAAGATLDASVTLDDAAARIETLVATFRSEILS